MSTLISNESPEVIPSPINSYVPRHIGLNSDTLQSVLEYLGFDDIDTLIQQVVPPGSQREKMNLPDGESEAVVSQKLHLIASKNEIARSFIGMGYYNCHTPSAIARNILENPSWYTAYTPYQPEIAQGRLEALLNFQTMVVDLTGLEVANSSMLDEGSAAAEAVAMASSQSKNSRTLFLSNGCQPHIAACIRTRSKALGLTTIEGEPDDFDFSTPIFCAVLPYPTKTGLVSNYRPFIEQLHENGGLAILIADLLSLTLFASPGELGADIAVGSVQRFGCPLYFGGPHVAYFATKQAYIRNLPGRLVGMSKDKSGKPALRLALQTREQHIKREKATSNICTSAVLTAVIASMYAVHHGPSGLKAIACRIQRLTVLLASSLRLLGFDVSLEEVRFDTVHVSLNKEQRQNILHAAVEAKINLCVFYPETLGVSLDETTSFDDVLDLLRIFGGEDGVLIGRRHVQLKGIIEVDIPKELQRHTTYLSNPVFNSYHDDTRLMRYIRSLETRDLSLMNSMIPLGSCTMKHSPASAMQALSLPGFSQIHPFAPSSQAEGYLQLIAELQDILAEATGFKGVSLQPTSGAQGEYAGLLTIRQYHKSRGEEFRNVCLIPVSAHGTNPASAVMAGMKIVTINCDTSGNVDIADLELKAEKYSDNLSALMITYPSTHGVFEPEIRDAIKIVHACGGQVYMDGANMNAQVGLLSPGNLGADVCHLNLHKTFALPHGGGGPGMGPICVAEHLVPFLPSHPVVQIGGVEFEAKINDHSVASSPWGNVGAACIPWAYSRLLGGAGLTLATKIAILNANYIARRLEPYFPILYKGESGLVAHECIIDLRPIRKSTGISVDDVAKRLIDYSFHPPTVSFPVSGTMMVEPTESESKEEMDRFCEAMISIHAEIKEIESGLADPSDNLLKNAPHPMVYCTQAEWNHSYSRERAAYPTVQLRDNKFWPTVSRIDGAYGDLNPVCTCPDVSSYDDAHFDGLSITEANQSEIDLKPFVIDNVIKPLASTSFTPATGLSTESQRKVLPLSEMLSCSCSSKAAQHITAFMDVVQMWHEQQNAMGSEFMQALGFISENFAKATAEGHSVEQLTDQARPSSPCTSEANE